MYMIIIGGSLLATELSRKLVGKDNKVTLVVKDKNKAIAANEVQGLVVVNGNPLDAEILDDLNLSECDVFIAATEQEEVNILSALYAKNAGISKIFVKTQNPESEKILRKLSIDVVNPEDYAAASVELKILRPTVSELVNIGIGQFDIIERRADRFNQLVGMRMSQVRGAFFSTIAIYKQGRYVFHGETLIEQNSILIIILTSGKDKELDKVLKTLKSPYLKQSGDGLSFKDKLVLGRNKIKGLFRPVVKVENVQDTSEIKPEQELDTPKKKGKS